jgi:Sulfatase
MLAYAGAHLSVLSAFALAQPLFDLLARNAEFFAVRGSTRSDIVAFALGVLLIPTAAFLLLEALALLAGVYVWRAVHLLFVALLSGLVVLHVVQRHAGEFGVGLLVAAGIAGAALTACYLLFSPVRTFLTVLTPAPLVFTALFLFHSPVEKLLAEETETATAAAVVARTPVVLVVFDEFGTVPILDARGRVDTKRFPSFGSLAEDATFYRDTTTVHAWTEHAVPAILSGRLPRHEELPILADHPRNLFTLLGRGYRIVADESETHLCPRRLCKQAEGELEAEAAPKRVDSFASDVSIVYLHVLLPDSLARHLPAVDRSWRDFRGGAVAAEQERAGPTSQCAPACALVDNFDPEWPATLYFLHALTPHVPWRHLPSGKTYVGDTNAIPGLKDSVWQGETFLTRQAYARYLLQVGFTDRALGLILDRLHETGVYDRSLVVVTADHGVSFQEGRPRRDPTSTTLDEIAFVPLFVKVPHQRRGRIQDGFVRTVDILPTIADVLDVHIPWPVAGRSLLRGRPEADGTVAVMADDGAVLSSPLSQLLEGRREQLREQVEAFGTGDWHAVFRAGPLADLVGRRLADLRVVDADWLRLDLDGEALYDAVDRKSPLIPAFVTGRIDGGSVGWSVAVAINGRIVATGITYESSGEAAFAIVAPEGAFTGGRNDIDVLVSPTGRSDVALTRVQPSEPELTFDGTAIRRADGAALTLSTDSIRGELHVRSQPGRLDFAGWAADVELQRPVDAVAVFVDGRLLYTASGQAFRRERPAEEDGIEGVGFGFALPEGSLPEEDGDEEVRVFALSDDRAAELLYEPGYPWGR